MDATFPELSRANSSNLNYRGNFPESVCQPIVPRGGEFQPVRFNAPIEAEVGGAGRLQLRTNRFVMPNPPNQPNQPNLLNQLSLQSLAPRPESNFLAPLNFLAYARHRRRIVADPHSAIASLTRNREPAPLFIFQGLILPTVLILILLPMRLPRPLFRWDAPSRSEQIATASRMIENRRFGTSPDGYFIEQDLRAALRQSSQQEFARRHTAILNCLVFLLVVPVTVVVAALLFPYRVPRRESGPASAAFVRNAALYVFGSHFFWMHAANSTLAVLILFMLDELPTYRVALALQFAYLLCAILVLGAMAFNASRDVRRALQLPLANPVKRYFLGDSIRWDLFGLHFVVGFALLGLLRLF